VKSRDLIAGDATNQNLELFVAMTTLDCFVEVGV